MYFNNIYTVKKVYPLFSIIMVTVLTIAVPITTVVRTIILMLFVPLYPSILLLSYDTL